MSNPKLKFVAVYYGNPQSGINKKMVSQVLGLIKGNIDAELVYLGNKGENDVIVYDFVKFIPTKTPPYKSLLDKIAAMTSLRKGYEKVLLEGDKNEIIYLRNYLPTAWFVRAVKKSPKKIILELPSNLFGEALARKAYFFYAGLLLYHKQILKNVDLIIGTTTEIIYNHFDPEKYKVDKMIIGNGIQLDTVPLRKATTSASSAVFNFTCVAELSPFHGIDRIIRGMHLYKGKEVVNLHIVGKGSQWQTLKDLTEELKLTNVTFHGFLGGEKLNDIFEQTDLAIGSLAIHRSNVKTNSSLKAREYCARGLPFVNSGKDEEFGPDFPFIYEIESGESPVDIASFVDFLKKTVVLPDYKMKMRSYAVEALSWDSKMKKLADHILKN
jgi:hypothetical protein